VNHNVLFAGEKKKYEDLVREGTVKLTIPTDLPPEA
jgi:hypothetical protein